MKKYKNDQEVNQAIFDWKNSLTEEEKREIETANFDYDKSKYENKGE